MNKIILIVFIYSIVVLISAIYAVLAFGAEAEEKTKMLLGYIILSSLVLAVFSVWSQCLLWASAYFLKKHKDCQ